MDSYLDSIRKQFEYYKLLGDKSFVQLTDQQLFWQINPDSNSIAIIVKHLWGNMRSRWTSFLTTDGEKSWRNREAEFEADFETREELLEKWNAGWTCLFEALDEISSKDLEKVIYIRNMGHTVVEALNRQLAHYAYHVGQIVYIARMLAGPAWQSLSIPKGTSDQYNRAKFAQPKRKEHFTKDFLDKNNG